MLPLQISTVETKKKIDAGEARLLDCREPLEWDLARIEGAELIPMNTVPAEVQRIEAMADGTTLVVYCHHGVRSLNVANWLRGQGIENVQSMAGGIDDWSLTVDRTVVRY